MDSPETNKIPSSSPKVQDSPFFNYLSNLSPIKPSKSSHAGRVFADLNLSTPPPVFTSPRINPQRETSILKSDRGKIHVAGQGVSQTSMTKSNLELIPSTCGNKDPVQSQPSSPGSVDEYLTDPLEECASPADSPGFCLKQAADVFQALKSGCNSPRETIQNVNDDGNFQYDAENEIPGSTSASKNDEEGLRGQTSQYPIKPVAAEDHMRLTGQLEQKNDDRSHGERWDAVSENTSGLGKDAVEPASNNHCDQHVLDQTAAGFASLMSNDKKSEALEVEKNMTSCSSGLHLLEAEDFKMCLSESEVEGESQTLPKFLPESSQNIQVDNILSDNLLAVYNRITENQLPYDSEEGNTHQHGLRRRCLQFEVAEAHTKSFGSSSNSWHLANNVSDAWSPPSAMASEATDTSQAESGMIPSSFSQHSASRLSFCSYKTPETQNNKFDGSARSSTSSAKTAPIPFGIGLHLNSIGNAVPVSCGANMEVTVDDDSDKQGVNSMRGSNHHFPQDSKAWLVSASLVGNLSVPLTAKSDLIQCDSIWKNSEVNQLEIEASVMANSSTNSQTSPINMKPLSSSADEHMILCENKRPASQDICVYDDFNQMSPRKSRRRATLSVENEGCKRCNCKRSKCLKLYCECFAAGVYCAEPCACVECFNKPEYEDTVLGARQHIESRNPLAFAPKIVRRLESPKNSGEDGNRTTPASARHKRGCNCKRSMCQKKYCECYQAGVGCSDGCRCEGCKNVYGRKEGCIEITEAEDRKTEDEQLDKDLPDGKMNMLEVRTDIIWAEQCHSDHLSPLTPLFGCSNHGRDLSKSRQPGRRHLTSSPSSEASGASSRGRSPRSSVSSFNNNRFVKAREGNAGPIPCDAEFDCHKHAKVNVNHSSPKSDGFADICDLNPLPLHSQSNVTTSTLSDIGHSSKASGALSCHVAGRVGSLRWRCTPVTPISRFGGSKFVTDSDSDSGLCNILEDETPDILKETLTPIKTVKVSSPNQKRISPPHNCLNELRRSSSSPGLRSGRKFILQSVPSFPPLTPYSESKGSEK